MKSPTVLLIVERENPTLLEFASIIRNLDYCITDIVNNPKDAIKIAVANQPDILLMDIGLLGAVDGVETARKIQQQVDIPIIYILENYNDTITELAEIGNPYGYIQKPFNEREIKPILDIALFRHRRENDNRKSLNQNKSNKYYDNEERYLRLAELSTDSIIIHSEGMIVFINSSAVRVFGAISAQELIGRNILDFVHEDYYDRVITPIQCVSKDSILPELLEVKFIRVDGSEFFVEVTASIVQFGTKKGIQSVFRDISERKNNEENLRKSETLFRQVWENSRDGMRLVDTNGMILLANPAYCEMIGKPQNEVIGKSYSTMYADEYQVGLLDTFRQRIDTNSIITYYEKKLRLWNGKELWLELSNSYVDTEGEKPPYLLSIIRDITDRKTSEEKIQKSLMEKEALLKELHHRVKNNMQIISSLLHLQEQNISDKAVSAPLRESQNRVKSMALIHEQLYQSDNLSEVNITVYLRQLSSRLLRSIIGSKRNITVVIQPENDSILMNINVAIPIGLILNELITNALKYAFTGKTKGEIKISIDKNANNMVQMIIQDNGNGIPAEINITNSETLGLQLVHSLSSQLGGVVQYNSSSLGTIFTITFPER